MRARPDAKPVGRAWQPVADNVRDVVALHVDDGLAQEPDSLLHVCRVNLGEGRCAAHVESRPGRGEHGRQKHLKSHALTGAAKQARSPLQSSAAARAPR